MATYTIVASGTSPLGPGEIEAGSTVSVNSGDVFIIDPSADDDVKFEAAGGGTPDITVLFATSNANDFKVEFKDSFDVTIGIADNVDISGIDIKADKANSVDLTAGNGVSIGDYKGSKDGADTLTFGDNFTTTGEIKTEGGNDSITLGNNASVKEINTGKSV